MPHASRCVSPDRPIVVAVIAGRRLCRPGLGRAPGDLQLRLLPGTAGTKLGLEASAVAAHKPGAGDGSATSDTLWLGWAGAGPGLGWGWGCGWA